MLKQLKLQAELKQRQLELTGLQTRQADFKTRQANLATALGEAESAEDTTLVENQIADLDKEVSEAGVDEKVGTVEAEIERINGELAEIETRTSTVTSTATTTTQTRERKSDLMNKYQVRELLKTGEYYERAEVKEFYEGFKNLRTVGGEGLTIPLIVINRIMDILGDYSTLYPLVNKIRVNGTARILIDTDTSAATWIEQTGTLATGTVGTITNIDFDGYKIGKVTFVDNCMLQDSIINLDDYVSKKLARAIALGLDLSILKGTGSAGKQPEGVLAKLGATHITEADVTKLVNVIKKLALIDTGADSTSEIVCVMKRATYYNRFVEFSINVDSNGSVVGKLPNLTNPDILGLKVIFNQNMDEDILLFGEFDKYTLVERESIVIDKSEHVKFAEDQMGFRGKGRFDGKPTNVNAFVAINLDLGVLQSLTVTSAAGTATGDTKITVTEAKMLGRTYQYKTHATVAPTAAYGDVLTGWTAWDGVADITATATHKLSLCEVGNDGKVKKYGTATVTVK